MDGHERHLGRSGLEQALRPIRNRALRSNYYKISPIGAYFYILSLAIIRLNSKKFAIYIFFAAVIPIRARQSSRTIFAAFIILRRMTSRSSSIILQLS